MAVNGPYLERLRKELTTWAVDYRQKLIQALEDGGVYGTVPLSPDEQVSRFIESRSEDYLKLIQNLHLRYKGLDDMDARINADIARYLSHMITLMQTRGMLTPEQSAQETDNFIGGLV